MISYCLFKYFVNDASDYEDLVFGMVLMSLTIFIDILFLIFQPIFYLLVKKYEKENAE